MSHKFPNPPHVLDAKWARQLIRSLNQFADDLEAFRTATGIYDITASVEQRTITSTVTATELREFVARMAKDLQEKGHLP